MGKIACLGDLHIGVRDGKPHFLEFQTEWLKYFLEDCKAKGVTHVIQCGDMNDVRKFTHNNVLEWYRSTFVPMVVAAGIDWSVIVGNHDIFYRNSNEIYSTAFLPDLVREYSEERVKFRVYNRPQDVFIEGKVFLMLPWLDEQNSRTLQADLKASQADYCIAHLDLAGAPLYTGMPSKHGEKYETFKQFKQVFTGHYHTISQHMNVTYVGSPYHLTWMDAPDGKNRGWWLFDTETGHAELQRNEDHHSLFSMIEYDPARTYTKEDLEPFTGNIIKVLVEKKDNEKRFKAFMEILYSLEAIDVQVIDNTIIEIKNPSAEKIDPDKFQTNTLGMMLEFIKNQDTMDVEGVSKLATKLYQEVN